MGIPRVLNQEGPALFTDQVPTPVSTKPFRESNRKRISESYPDFLGMRRLIIKQRKGGEFLSVAARWSRYLRAL